MRVYHDQDVQPCSVLQSLNATITKKLYAVYHSSVFSERSPFLNVSVLDVLKSQILYLPALIIFDWWSDAT